MSKKIIIPLIFVVITLSIIFVLVFNKTKNNSLSPQNPCIVAGCSGQFCVNQNDEPIISTCEWTDQYACYKNAECKLQSNNQCGFTPTDELKKCLNQFTQLNKPAY